MSTQTHLTPDELRRLRGSAKKQGFIPPTEQIAWAVNEQGARIILPCLPPTKNDWKGCHPMQIHRLWYNPWFEWFEREYTISPVKPKLAGRVDIRIRFCYPDRRRRDRLNMASYPPLMDALTRTGIIEDDSDGVIRHMRIVKPIIDGSRKTIIAVQRVME